MQKVTIYHNPRCSKSRQTLQILVEMGIEPHIIDYLKTPPSMSEIKNLSQKLNKLPLDFIRLKEDEYTLIENNPVELSDDEICQIMSENPKLIERPIVVVGDKAIIGRPPEKVRELF